MKLLGTAAADYVPIHIVKIRFVRIAYWVVDIIQQIVVRTYVIYYNFYKNINLRKCVHELYELY